MSEMALIRFVVMDKDVVSDDYIGQATFPINSLQEGIDSVFFVWLHVSVR